MPERERLEGLKRRKGPRIIELRQPLWERQPGESKKAYELFVSYRDDDAERAYIKTASKHHRALRWIAELGTIWKWQQRVAAWDRENERRAAAEQQQEIIAMKKRHASIAAMAQNVVIRRLRELNKMPEDAPIALSNRDLIYWFAESSRIERLSRGEPTEHVHQQHTGESEEAIEERARIIAKNAIDRIMKEYGLSLEEAARRAVKFFPAAKEWIN